MRLAATLALILLVGCSHGSNAVMPAPQGPGVSGGSIVGQWQTLPISGVPYAMAPGKDGGMWMVFNNTSTVSRVDPVTGKQLSYKLSGTDLPFLTPNPDGNIYVAEVMADGSSSIAQVSPAGNVSEFSLPGSDALGRIISGSDGAIWMTRSSTSASYVARMDTFGKYIAFPNQYPATVSELVRGSDKNLWGWGEANGVSNAVRVSIQDGSLTWFQSPLTMPTEGSDGMIWSYGPGPEFVQTDMKGVSTTYPVGTNRLCNYAASNHLLWWVQNSRLLGFNTTTHKVTKHITFPDQTSAGLAVRGPDGRIWTTDGYSDNLFLYTIP